MNTQVENRSPLLPQRAFVVQFRSGTDVAQGTVSGRIEHVTSGQATLFASWAELQDFIARVLPAVRAGPGE
jgi:hypothetical protein